MTADNSKEDVVVIELKSTYLPSLSDALENAFPEERDSLLARIPDIRAQFEEFEIYHEEEEGQEPPGYLRLSRREAQQLASLLEHLDNGRPDISNAASEIRAQAEQAAAGDPDVMTMSGTRFGWAEAAAGSGLSNRILVEVYDEANLHQKGRFKKASMGRNSDGNLMFQMEIATKCVERTMKATPIGEMANFTVRIQPDGNLQLEHVELVNAS